MQHWPYLASRAGVQRGLSGRRRAGVVTCESRAAISQGPQGSCACRAGQIASTFLPSELPILPLISFTLSLTSLHMPWNVDLPAPRVLVLCPARHSPPTMEIRQAGHRMVEALPLSANESNGSGGGLSSGQPVDKQW